MSYVIRFNYAPPLTANQRLHWRQRAMRTKILRGWTLEQCDALSIPAMQRCRVSMTWYVTTSHRRDVDNIVPTLKACCDGIVDAGVVPDDVPEVMEKVMPRIARSETGESYFEIEIEEIK